MQIGESHSYQIKNNLWNYLLMQGKLNLWPYVNYALLWIIELKIGIARLLLMEVKFGDPSVVTLINSFHDRMCRSGVDSFWYKPSPVVVPLIAYM
jgi:hypothetical protein